MSDLGCPGDRPGTGKCFKGVENFLKRIAFNLGNTPSRTEVKIISCIPIDVSDLQQRIILLEKELEEARLCDDIPCASPPKRVINTVLLGNQYPVVSHTGVSCNALDMDRGTNPYDVTLSTKKKSNLSFAAPSAHASHINSSSSHQYVRTTAEKRYADIMGYDNDLKPFSVGEVKQHQGRKKFFKKKKKNLRLRKPKSHYVYYAQAGRSAFEKSYPIEDLTRNNKTMNHSYLSKVVNKQYKPQVLGGNLSEISRFSKFSTPICRDSYDFSTSRGNNGSDICSCCQGAYHNIDHQPILYDNQQVYRADNITTGGGFYDSTFYDVIPVKEKPVKINKKPFENMKKREAKPSVDIMCWPEDVRSKLRTYPAYNPFFLDYTTLLPGADNYLRKIPKMYKKEPVAKNIPKRRNNIDKQINLEMSKSSCIDFGDVYPKLVRKKIDRVDRCLHVDKCLPATEVPHKVDAECLTTATNNSECQTVSSIIHTTTRDSIQSSDDKTEETLNQIKTILQSVLHEVKGSSLIKGASDEKPKKDATVQKGMSQGNMPGPLHTNLAGSKPVQVPGPVLSNMPGSVHGNISRLLHGNVQSSIPDTIQAVPHSNVAENLPCNLTSNIQGSRLLGSFTYSPYDIPPYLPSCSKQMNPYYYSQSPIKCFQNFPLIVPNQGRPTCASCFRQSGYTKSHYGKKATTIATNTDSIKVQHSKETEKLIKEIYKSMALTMGAVKNENSSEYEPLNDYSSHIEKAARTEIEKPAPVKEFKKVTNVVQAVSELFRKRDMQVSSESYNLIESRLGSNRDRTDRTESRYGSHNTNTAAESKYMSTDTTVLSGLATATTTPTNTETEMQLRKDRVDKYMNQSKRAQGESPRQDKQKYHARPQNKMAVVELSETSSSETETDDTFVPQETKQVTPQKERKEKTSLFSKMFRSVKLFKPRERKKREKKEAIAEEPTSEESSTDSDDYQTIYSQKMDTNPKHRPRVYNLSKRRTHSKISYKHVYQREKSPEKSSRRSPYMEQEYRRYWNEKLMYQNRHQQQSYEDPYSQRYTIEQARRAHPYYQAYEARAAIVEPIRPMPRNTGPIRPMPRNTGPLRPMPRNAEPIRPMPRNTGPIRPMPRNTETMRPMPRNAETIRPMPRNTETIMPMPRNTEPIRPVPRNTGVGTPAVAKRVVVPKQIKKISNKVETRITSKAVPWLKKHKLGNIRCGEHFRHLIYDN